MFPSPLGVISFFTIITEMTKKEFIEDGFRPLSGLSLFLLGLYNRHISNIMVSVPSRGYLFFYSIPHPPLFLRLLH